LLTYFQGHFVQKRSHICYFDSRPGKDSLAGFFKAPDKFKSNMGDKNQILIGTSGWSYKHWAGLYYPDGLKPTEFLSWYAKEFETAEINTSFYHLPKETSVSNWLQQVPEDFIFCPKMSRYLIHMKKLHDAKEPVDRFCDIFDKMKNQMGPVLIQLPADLRFRTELTEGFYRTLKAKKAYRFAMEVRHDSWFCDESIKLMEDYNISLVLAHSQQFPYFEAVTAKDVYVRFHGPNELYASSYDDNFLADYAEKFKKWQREKHNIWAFFNNDVNGYAFRNAARIKEMIG